MVGNEETAMYQLSYFGKAEIKFQVEMGAYGLAWSLPVDNPFIAGLANFCSRILQVCFLSTRSHF